MATTLETNRTSFETRQLGNSDLKLTPIGFGAWAIGGGNWDFGWGPQDDRESVDAILRALDGGVNWIDTAAIYGLGHSEEIVAKALAATTKKPYVFTKCSMRWNENRQIYRSLKKDSLREELENSLRRLKLRRDRPLPDSLARSGSLRSKKAGRRWRASRKRERCATSASPTSMWSR